MATPNKISYTSKDANSIYSDLLNAIPLLTDKWKNYAEDDPGVVLLKLASFVGDMLCYNMDAEVNETFPQTARQRKNAQKSYDLIGYKMHWFRSAECSVTLNFNRPNNYPISNPITILIPEFTELVSPEGLHYVIIGNDIARTITLNANQNMVSKDFVAVQGIRSIQLDITPDKIIEQGRIYLPSFNIDEDEQNDLNYAHMRLYEYDSGTNLPIYNSLWTKVSNLLDTRDDGRYYELRISDKNQPYIQLCDNYLNYISQTNNYLGLTYISSEGSEGAVSENIGFEINDRIVFNYSNYEYYLKDYVTVYNSKSNQGRNPETVEEAAKSAAKEARTFNVAVTLEDYEILCRTIDGVRACQAVDSNSDIGKEFDAVDLRSLAVITDNIISFSIPDMLGYELQPNYVLIEITIGSETVAIVDNEYGKLVLDADGEFGNFLGASNIDYRTGRVNIDLTSLGIMPTTENLNSLLANYVKKRAPYSVALRLVANDYGYVPDYARVILATMLTKKTISVINPIVEHAEINSVPFNIGIYAYEPWRSADASLSDYIRKAINTALINYFDSPDREFGEVLSYPSLSIVIQEADPKIKLADIYNPLRNYEVPTNHFPRLGPLCVNLEDNPNHIWLVDNLLAETISANSRYNALATELFGSDGVDIDYNKILGANASVDEITEPLNLVNSVSAVFETPIRISWWCSRPDLVIVRTSNESIWGNLNSADIVEDTFVTLFAIAHYGDASLVLAHNPINLLLKAGV